MGVIAFSGATHDIATDGIYMTELDNQTQARYIGWQGAFFNIAKVVANGGLVFIAGMLKNTMGVVHAWMFIMGICAGIMILLSLWHSRVLPSGGTEVTTIKTAKEGWNSFKHVFVTFFQKKNITIYIIFIILYRLAEGLAIKILPLFLKAPVEKGGLALTVSQIGLINGTFGAVAFILGSILAGYYISHRGLKKHCFIFVVLLIYPF